MTDLDKTLVNGGCSEEILNTRALLLKELHDLIYIDSLEIAQKAKVRWSIEGDGNSKYFHGILNKKRSQLAIRGVLVDGEWITDPCKKVQDLERNVSYDEIKSAVWDCGHNKSSGPDGFTFEFFLRYWNIIDLDVVAAVSDFFSSVILLGLGSQDKPSKSKLMRVGVQSEDIVSTTTIVGCSTFTSPFNYLDVKVGGAFKSFNSIAKRSTWLDIVREVSTLSTKGFLMDKYGDLNVGELVERMQQDKGSGEVDSPIETDRHIEAGDCEDTLDRLTNDERKAAMDAFTVWGANLLAHMSDLNLIILMEHMVSVPNTGNVVANAFNNGLGTSPKKIQSSLEKVAFLVVDYYVCNDWSKYGLTRVMMNSKGFFYFKFESRKGLEDVLENESWMIRDEISLIATQIGKLIMLDSFTSSRCIDSWGRSSFKRCLIEIRSRVDERCGNSLVVINAISLGSLLQKFDPSKKLHAKKGGPHVHTCKTSVPTSNPYDVLNDLESEDEAEVVYDETVNLKSTRTGASPPYGS
ncbi:hypothetical protein Tco_0628593 [Tanacetum coccineum]|uniref:DUF4283 domain-containing protein n=1 Tax=Tanacetum coccineum TaxID=301880 RepID=A0ABQ4WRH3_9ASTR